MENLVKKLKIELVSHIENDQLSLQMPTSLLREIRQMAQSPSIANNKLASLIAGDDELQSELIKLANSPLRSEYRCINSITSAIYHLGLSHSCQLVERLTLEKMFRAPDSNVDRILRDIWVDSVQVALLSNFLARNYTDLDPDIATLAGLTHQIGILPLVRHILLNQWIWDEYEYLAMEDLVQALHADLGQALLASLGFPEAIICVPGDHQDLLRDNIKADYADLVQIAKLQYCSNEKRFLAGVDKRKIPAYEKLGIDPDNFDNPFKKESKN